MKALLPFFIVWALLARNWLHVICGIGLLGICLSYSVTSSLGFASLNRTATVGKQDIQAALNAESKASLPDIRKELRSVNKKLKWRLSGRDRLRLRKRRTALEAQRSSAQAALGRALASGTTYVVEDPQADFLAGITGVSKKNVEIWLIFLVAALVEMGSTLGLFLSFGHLRGAVAAYKSNRRIEALETAIDISGNVHRLATPKMSNALLLPNQATADQVRNWLEANTTPLHLQSRDFENMPKPDEVMAAFTDQTGLVIPHKNLFYKACVGVFRERGWPKMPHLIDGRRYPVLIEKGGVTTRAA